TGNVEVAQLDSVERLPVHLGCGGLVVDHPFADELGLAVGIDRAGLEVLADHVDVGHSIGRGRGGEDERFDPGGLDGGEDVRQRNDVLPVVHDRRLDALADLLLRGEVDGRVDRVLLDGGGQAVLGIGGRQIEIDDVQSVDSGCQAGREVVD